VIAAAVSRPSLLLRLGRGLALRAVTPALSVLAAFTVSSVIILAVGANPLIAYEAMFRGAFGSVGSLATTGVRMTPILFTGLAVALSFRAGIFNVGAEGQLYAGAALGAAIALAPLGIPGVVQVTLALVGGMVGGALWALVPGYLRAYRGVSEVVTTLMLNFVGILLVSYLVDPIDGPIGQHGAAYAQSLPIQKVAELPILIRGTSLHAGLILGIALAVGLFVLIGYTPLGFRLRMLGSNPLAARFAGLRSAREIMTVMLLSGGIAGLAGAVEVIGLRYRLYDHFSPGYGYDGIAVALLGGSNPIGVIFSSGFFGALRAGANSMQQATGIETSVVLSIQALTILFVILGPLRDWTSARARRDAEQAAANAA
jgi:ABC-type uncharacterized transport system permease subunit